ncbi:similar to Saccharomyces cerevisiae YLL004W ORC3 Subunit of the origin recognition complex [Maudiozyma barnettii]|uniref:Similar to Saccharomyces cerevisiae YLL004W ORC3 Subunit of the origin recognition complex n=1 Tax=Maudiozyma barnettii TaxID=61262 RepID=A0A8H2ZHG7_9SACH|nr:origin recognition complex subunit 3 [Kazachstania barnettii]CAB4252114.1 similar to Saccharomyces cerevisiae YLL004W ORC3 Subunit of the origin recognition complex [Kazachstania barnettii]CAD1778645.1 similar to Saccharomyces cerevisiae YLL004W ORC3 Subunit of the origin recognition complex [Kazachstania barnettii]
MNINEFADAQKTHNVIYPILPKDHGSDERCIPFVPLLDGDESTEIMHERWQLYNQLYIHFHSQVDNIVSNGEIELKHNITKLLFSDDHSLKTKETFRTLFLLGSDSDTPIEFDIIDPTKTVNVLVDMTAKESPNVRMMLKRAMFKVFSTAQADYNNIQAVIKENGDNESISEALNGMPQLLTEVSYDLSLIENFKSIFGKDLNIVLNFKDVDSFSFHALDAFIQLLKNALKYESVMFHLVFNINTNISIMEKNLSQSTLRLLKRNYSILDISSNRGFKYANKVFECFLETVDNKLNLSENFIEFILEKMANNTHHNLQLLTKILDYSLMSYFYENPFAVFIDPFNVKYLNDSYLKLLKKCPTYMFFLDELVKEGAPVNEISNLLTNEEDAIEQFFAEFLVRDNPTNRHAKAVANILEEKCNAQNYNLIELYYNLLTDNLDNYLKKWPECMLYKQELSFESVDTIFKELFTLGNKNDLLSEAMFPKYKGNMEDDLLCWERVINANDEGSLEDIQELESLSALNRELGPIVGELFKVYREAPIVINLFDLYTTFKVLLPRKRVLEFIRDYSTKDKALKKFINNNGDDDSIIFDKVVLILFMQGIHDYDNMGLTNTLSKNPDFVDKHVWRGM